MVRNKKKGQEDVYSSVAQGLSDIYKNKLLPLEKEYFFHDFHSPALDDPDFDAKPMVMLVGQYSTGKTTFIRYILEQDFPGIRIGPEPTTDGFIAVMYDETEGIIPGNAMVVDAKKRFRPLSKFGNAFLNRFQCSNTTSDVLKSLTIIDTPGILSGEKQRTSRGYDFTGVLKWFADRADRILLLFDAHKLDISDEFKSSIEALHGNDDKIRIVLNKADMVNAQQMMRVYGALMWSLGKVLKTPEVTRVYIGSFWNEALRFDTNRTLFEAEEMDLFSDLQSLPRNAAIHKLNDLIKRARLAKVQAYIISELKKEMPAMFGKEAKKKELIKTLDALYARLQREHKINAGDFPDLDEMKKNLVQQDFAKFRGFDKSLLAKVDSMLSDDIPRLLQMIPQEEAQQRSQDVDKVKGGAFDGVMNKATPFMFHGGDGVNAGLGEVEWVVAKDQLKYDAIFDTLNPVDGKLPGSAVKQEMVKSKLPNNVLGKIWKLSDVDMDGFLDAEEFALAMHLMNIKMDGHDLPSELPKHLVPPSKRSWQN